MQVKKRGAEKWSKSKLKLKLRDDRKAGPRATGHLSAPAAVTMALTPAPRAF